MSLVIPFVGQVDKAEELGWIAALGAKLPEVRIAPLSELTDEIRQAAQIAIVANPRPDELAALPNLVWIHSVWAGVERMVSELSDRDFEITRLIDPELSRTMAEAVLAWVLYLHRDMPAYDRLQKEHIWKALPYRKPAQRTVGILGLGALGQGAAEILRQHNFSVIGWSRSKKNLPYIQTFDGAEGLKSVISHSDILVVLLPLTDQTRELIDASLFAVMPTGAGLINFARGAILQTDDLVDALDNGPLAHAVLDVFETEPLPADDPLWEHKDITILPHISAPTDMETASEIVAGNIRGYLETDEFPERVDRVRGY